MKTDNEDGHRFRRQALDLAIILTILIFSLRCDSTKLSPVDCEATCYTGPTATLNVGTCRAGTPICEDGKMVRCFGEVIPAEEFCGSGLDTDCSGIVGDGDERNWDSCGETEIGQCEFGKFQCIDNQLVCVGAVGPKEEQCQRDLDFDCDGIPGNKRPTETCYDGPFEEISHAYSACHAGVLVCENGIETCAFQGRPSIEICDPERIDEDCDGIVNNVKYSSWSRLDVTLIVDISCSMADELPLVRTALSETLVQFGDRISLALILVPGPRLDAPAVMSDFTSPAQLSMLISTLDTTGGGDEASYDAMVQAANGYYQLTGRDDTLDIILYFGDEAGQSDLGYDEMSVTHILRDLRYSTYIFVPVRSPAVLHSYDDIAHGTAGEVLNLGSAAELKSDIIRIFEKSCP